MLFGSTLMGHLLGKDRKENCPCQPNVVNRRAGNRSCSVNESEVDFHLNITQQLAAVLTLHGKGDEQYNVCLGGIIRSLIVYKYFIPLEQKYYLFW